jgi:hypothetical protein
MVCMTDNKTYYTTQTKKSEDLHVINNPYSMYS